MAPGSLGRQCVREEHTLPAIRRPVEGVSTVSLTLVSANHVRERTSFSFCCRLSASSRRF
jgi:hypothetical protein